MVKKRGKLDRKAWLRILEAFLAVLIILSTILVIMSRQGPKIDVSETIYEIQRNVLEIVSKNAILRNDILIEENTNVNDLISNLAPAEWNYSTNICNLSLICPNPVNVYSTEVYSTEVVVSSNLTKYAPKKLRFFVWLNDR